MESVKITRVYHDKVETKYGTKDKTAIYTEQYPDVKMSSFDKAAANFKEGDTVDITVEKNGQFTNFKVGAGKGGNTSPVSSDLEARVKKLEVAVFGQEEATVEVETPKADTKDDFDDFAG